MNCKVTISLADLRRYSACPEGLEFFSFLSKRQRKLSIPWNALSFLWLETFRQPEENGPARFGSWLIQNGLAPLPSLAGLDLSGMDLRGVNLWRANLFQTNLSGANLQKTNLFEAYLLGANLSGANLDGVIFYRAALFGADLSGANLQGADLQGAMLQGANLQGANLWGANLKGAIRLSDPPPGWKIINSCLSKE